jgi:hypothetical protein
MPDDQTIVEGDAGFIGMASRLNPLQLQAGMVQYCENMRLDRGVAQTRKGAKRLGDGISAGTQPLVMPFVLGNDKHIISLARGGVGNLTATATISAHGYFTGDVINIRGASPAQYNGDFFVTVTGPNAFTYTMASDPGTNAVSVGLGVSNLVTFSDLPPGSGFTATYLISAAPSSTTFYISKIDGSGLATNSSWVTPSVTKVNTSTGASYTISALTNGMFTITGNSFVSNKSPIIQTVYDGGILASGVFSSPNYNDENEYIVLCGPTSAFLYRQDEPIEEIFYPSTGTAADEVLAATDTATCIQAFNRFYLLREADPALPGWEWKYTTASGIAVSSTTATVHITAHGLAAGMRVRIEEGNEAAFQGHEFDILSAATNSFTIAVPLGTPSDPSANIATRRVKPPLWWDGSTADFDRATSGVPAEGVTFKTLRSTGWASYIGNRLWIPDGRDRVAISDVLDPDLYDPFFQSFRANQGSNDYLVAIHPWVEGQALVFMRNSIWLANLSDTSNATGDTFTVDSAVSRLTLLTDEIGCVARRSVVTAGQFVFFLSDAGVYRLDTQLDLKLRANTQPLSDPIADQIDEINSDYAHLAVGRWWNNRYYLAVPIGENATANNTLFLWNALNSQWESRDTYAINLDELLVATYSSQRRLFAASRAGTLFLLDELDYGDDVPFSNTQDLSTDIPGYLLTRRYGWGSLNTKRLTRAKASLLLPAEASCELRAITTDYDADFQVATLANTSGEQEDYTLKAPLRTKATGLDLEYQTLTGRPTLRQISAEATRSASDPTETRTTS